LSCGTVVYLDNLVLPAPVGVWEVLSGEKKQEWLPPPVAIATGWVAGRRPHFRQPHT